jgi:hypothetical protein
MAGIMNEWKSSDTPPEEGQWVLGWWYSPEYPCFCSVRFSNGAWHESLSDDQVRAPDCWTPVPEQPTWQQR